MHSPPDAVIIMAAGAGTRMRSRHPKVLHPVVGRPLLGWVLALAQELQPAQIVVVTGGDQPDVADYAMSWAAGAASDVRCAVQSPPQGTADAVRVGLTALPRSITERPGATVLILSGDVPLLHREQVDNLLGAHRQASATVLTTRLAEPLHYGRVIRSGAQVAAIVEARDADAETAAITEINTGIYAFDAPSLVAAVAQITAEPPSNAQGEYYLTDAVAILVAAGRPVAAVLTEDATAVMGINDRAELAAADRIMAARIAHGWLAAGVTMIDPGRVRIEPTVTLEPDAVLYPDVHLAGATLIEADAVIGPETTLTDCRVGARSRVQRTTATGALIGADCAVGPYTYLRPGTDLGDGSKVGAYVEVKASRVGVGAKVPHLSYIGDAEIGEGTNIGAATVVVNYDGVAKHRTHIGTHVRIGSDTMLIAPVTIGDGAYTAAGSVITEDVPPGAMAVGRARQRTVPGWVMRRRPGTPSAAAAAAGAGPVDTVAADV